MKPKTARAKRQSLPADVQVSGVSAVGRYLREHPSLAATVPALCRRAREQFGPKAALALQLNRDPEFDDSYLILKVRLPVYGPNSRERIDAVWQEFEREFSGNSGWIIMTTDFRKANGDGV